MKNGLFFLFKLAITLTVILYIVYTVGWDTIVQEITEAHRGFFLGAVGVFGCSMILGSQQWRELLKMKNIEISPLKALQIYTTGLFFYNFMFGVVGGDAYKVTALHLGGDSGTHAFASTFLDRFFGLVVINIFALMGGTILLVSNIQRGLPPYSAMAVLFLFSTIFAVIFATLLSRRLQEKTKGSIKKLKWLPYADKIHSLLETTFINRKNRGERSILGKVAIYSFSIQTLRIVVHILCAAALGMYSHDRLPYFFIIIPIISLVMVVPLPFGVKEVFGGKLFMAAGFPSSATIMELLASIVAILCSLAGGVTFLMGNHTEASE
ncbi:lysylphosphatidylglycerol synthase transmembrane domain-containing protein [Chitinivibrio alkaliphilus]|uniref:Uncharacterized protein n=1 Tax=Chitinivibrio alkaliphilus ACht1 TaxID=1313304 RepID=U7D741_9BACT|nr:lysylphosphatidylglycerol synthase transmembrane domain-containing protein [Chitinivibrio alkaliphilus]ERP31371.1 hypothetical protein CALK_1717 [Chitinivibrio alkaliphilus ACht1]